MKWYLSLCVALGLLFCSCRLDDEEVGIEERSSCKVNVSYKLETRKYIRPSSPTDLEGMTLGERALQAPKYSAWNVEYCVSNDGNYQSTIKRAKIDNEPDYPLGTIGQTTIPEPYRLDKIVSNGAGAIAYNSAGEAIGSHDVEPGLIYYYEDLISKLHSPRTVLSAIQLEALKEGFRANGYNVEERDQILVVDMPRADGGVTRMMYDQFYQVEVGMVHRDGVGKLISRYDIFYEGDVSRPVPSGYRFVAPYTSPLTRTDMELVLSSTITNYSESN